MSAAGARAVPLRQRLAPRVGLALCGAALLVLLLAGGLDLHLQRRHLEDLLSLSAERIAENIRGATRDAMLRNDSSALYRTIAGIAAQRGVERIRIFNKEGRIRSSTRPDEVGRLVDMQAEQCTACHGGARPLTRLARSDRVRIFRDPAGARVLGVIAPIHNEPACVSACHAHGAAQSVLGVLDVQLSMAEADAALRDSQRQLAAALAAAVLGMGLLAALLLWRLVLVPVERLSVAMAAVAAGDWSTRLPPGADDEIGRLGRSWNALLDELGRAREELTGWNRTLEARVQEKTRELESAARQMVQVEKMASLGKLAAVVAHEINNPLAGIRTYARVLRRRLDSPAGGAVCGGDDEQRADTERILRTIDTEAGRCGDIVRNLLLFSRSSAARFAEEDVGPLVERCRMLVAHQAEMLGVTLESRVRPDIGRLECDAAQVQQLLLALAINALEATPAGGRVCLSAQACEADALRLSVTDTGVGIAREHLPRLFEPFFTTKQAGQGVGLGLAVVYGIVERHHGRVEVESQPGCGATFNVYLPRRQPAAAGGEDAA